MDGVVDPNAALAELVEDAPCGIVVTDPDGQLQYVNDTLKRWLRLPEGPVDGLGRLPDLMTAPGRLFYETQLVPMMTLQGFVREISCSLTVDGGAPLPVLLSGAARHDEDGKLVRCDYTIFDARERRVYEEELREARRKADELAAIVRTSPNAILSVDRAGIVSNWNAGAQRLFGSHARDALGGRVQDLVRFDELPDWFERAVERCRGATEAVFETANDEGKHFEITVVLIEENDPHTAGRYSVILRDITDRKRTEHRIRVAMAEMRHRIKNSFAVISGIARQTLPEEGREDFVRRLQALSRANDALTDTARKQADLMELLALTAEEAGGAERLRISGARVMLSPDQATSLSMALHELVTNALKYGALSKTGGYVQVDCAFPVNGDNRFRLVWQERDGPPVAPPTRRGFGSKMINTVLTAQLSANVEFDYSPEGVRCVIEFDVDADG